MGFRIIDMEAYPRKQHFNYFSSMTYPYVGLTSNVDITDFYRNIKEKKQPFFLSLLWKAANAANKVPEFRQRIQDGGIIEYDYCNTSHTVAKSDGTYGYCVLDCSIPFDEFLPYAQEKQEKVSQSGDIFEDERDAMSYLFVSSLPWLTYTALVQPVTTPPDSNPRITWGKFFTEGNRIILPLSVLCNHALVDGRQISDFYSYFSL